MGNVKPTSIGEVLFSGVQRRVLGILFGHPDQSFYANEIVKMANTGRGALQRELTKLTSAGLITMKVSGVQKHYQANKDSPIFNEIRGIVLKTFGIAQVLRDALADHGSAIRCAFVYGSVAKGTDTASSDIDLMIIAVGIGYSQLFEGLQRAEETLGRKVSPTMYSPDALLSKIDGDNQFVIRVLDQPKIFVIGDESDLPTRKSSELVEDRQPEG